MSKVDTIGHAWEFLYGSQTVIGLPEPYTLDPSAFTGGSAPIGAVLPVFNVVGYGAVGDGIADDTVAIQVAFDEADAAGGGVVYFPPGTYILGATLTPPSGATIQGAGSSSSIIKRKSTFKNDPASYLIQPSAGNIAITDLGFDGNYPAASGTSAANGDVIGAGDDVLIARCRFFNPTEKHCIEAHGTNVRIQNCDFVGTGIATNGATFANIYGIWAATTTSVGMVIDGCTFRDFNWAAMLLGGTGTLSNSYIENCHLSSLAEVGGGSYIGFANFEIDQTLTGWKIIGNTFAATDGLNCNGIEIYNGQLGHLVVKNTFYGLSHAGVLVSGDAANVTIANNVIRSCCTNTAGSTNYAGIMVNGGATNSNITITGNRVFDDQMAQTQANGVVIYAGVTNYTITGNDLTGNINTTGLRDLAGAGTVIGNLPSINTVSGALTVKPTLAGVDGQTFLDNSDATRTTELWFKRNGVNKWAWYNAPSDFLTLHNADLGAILDISLSRGDITINRSARDQDFTIGGDTDASLFSIDGSADAVGFGTAAPTAKVDINSNILRVRTAKTPASAAAAGNQGDWCWDSGFLYICTATNTWKRVAIATW